jgi:hypothetical protein
MLTNSFCLERLREERYIPRPKSAPLLYPDWDQPLDIPKEFEPTESNSAHNCHRDLHWKCQKILSENRGIGLNGDNGVDLVLDDERESGREEKVFS